MTGLHLPHVHLSLPHLHHHHHHHPHSQHGGSCASSSSTRINEADKKHCKRARARDPTPSAGASRIVDDVPDVPLSRPSHAAPSFCSASSSSTGTSWSTSDSTAPSSSSPVIPSALVPTGLSEHHLASLSVSSSVTTSLSSSPSLSLQSVASSEAVSPSTTTAALASTSRHALAVEHGRYPNTRPRPGEMSAEFPPDSLPQFNRHGRLTAATSELLDDATVPCLAYGTPRPILASEDFVAPPPYSPSRSFKKGHKPRSPGIA